MCLSHPFSIKVRIFREIHNNLYLKSERRLSPTSLASSRQDSQRGAAGGDGGGRGRSSLPIYVSPLMFNNPESQPSFEPRSAFQHLPMGPLRSNSIPSHCEIHSYSAVHPGEANTEYTEHRLLPTCHLLFKHFYSSSYIW